VSRLTATAKASQERGISYPDVDSSSWYLKSDHDVIMKLSSVRKDYHLNSSHDTSRVTKTTSTNTTTHSTEQLNVQADHRASDALDELRLVNPRVLPDTCRSYLCDSTGILPVAKYTRSEPNSLSTSSERTFSDATTGQTRSMIPSAGLLTDQPAQT
jgi:hypothetical protein